jgi:hypothetical protein
VELPKPLAAPLAAEFPRPGLKVVELPKLVPVVRPVPTTPREVELGRAEIPERKLVDSAIPSVVALATEIPPKA